MLNYSHTSLYLPKPPIFLTEEQELGGLNQLDLTFDDNPFDLTFGDHPIKNLHVPKRPTFVDLFWDFVPF